MCSAGCLQTIKYIQAAKHGHKSHGLPHTQTSLIETQTEESSSSPTKPPTEAPQAAEPTPLPPDQRLYHPPEDGLTHITIDGDPSDWLAYPVGIMDPVGDSQGEVDITYIYAIANQEYICFLFEVAGEIGDYIQLDIDINPTIPDGWPPDYMVVTRPYEESRVLLNCIQDGEFSELGEMGVARQDTAFELRLPLESFDGPPPETFRLRIMDGVCCGADWKPVDDSEPVAIF
jgi:hypothetical protein